MSTNKRPLKAFVRFDGNGKAVSSSLIWRKVKPKVGSWKEIDGYECCNYDQAPVIVNIQSGFPFSYPDLVLESDSGNYTYQYYYGDNTTVNDIYELAAYNNSKYGFLGKFSVVSGDLVFTPKASTAAYFAAAGAVGIAVYSFSD